VNRDSVGDGNISYAATDLSLRRLPIDARWVSCVVCVRADSVACCDVFHVMVSADRSRAGHR